MYRTSIIFTYISNTIKFSKENSVISVLPKEDRLQRVPLIMSTFLWVKLLVFTGYTKGSFTSFPGGCSRGLIVTIQEAIHPGDKYQCHPDDQCHQGHRHHLGVPSTPVPGLLRNAGGSKFSAYLLKCKFHLDLCIVCVSFVQ